MKRGGLAIVGAGVALLVAVGGVVVWQQRSRVRDLEARLELALGQIEQGQSERDRASRETADLESRVERQRGRLKKAEQRWREQQSCVSRLSDEDAIGGQTVSFGVVTAVNDSRRFLFDPADWFVGEDANMAAAEDGEIEPGGNVPNDYYIRNDEHSEVTKWLDESAVVVLSTADRHNIPAPKCVTPRGFQQAFRSPSPWEEGIRVSPYWLVERDGVVIRLVEQYLP